MKRLVLGAAVLIAAAAVYAGFHAATVRAQPGSGAPIVVELFQSQGCSSCPPANANVNAVADRPDLLVLSFAVTYWDQLGWHDTFDDPAYTRRQWDYARGLHHPNVFTPQVVINGARDLVGIDPRGFTQAVAQARHAPALISVAAGQVRIAAGPRPPAAADVWLVRYDPRVLQVPIARGENAGRTLPHRHIVRQLTRLGGWMGQAAILLQTRGGPILSAARL